MGAKLHPHFLKTSFIFMLVVFIIMLSAFSTRSSSAGNRLPKIHFQSASRPALKVAWANSNVGIFSLDSNVLQDPSFEAYTPNPYWDEESTNFGTPLCNTTICNTSSEYAAPRTGSAWSWFGGTTSDETGSLSQTVTIPSGAATLQFYLWIGYAGPGSSTDDIFSAKIDGVTLFTADATESGVYPSYMPINIDVSAYADGNLHNVTFSSSTTGQQINFNLDDVALCSGECDEVSTSTPTRTPTLTPSGPTRTPTATVVLPANNLSFTGLSFASADINSVAVYETGNKVYVGDAENDAIIVLDGTTNQEITTITGVPAGGGGGLIVNETYGKVYFYTNTNTGVLDAATDQVLSLTLPDGYLVHDEVNDTLYIIDGNASSYSIQKLDIATDNATLLYSGSGNFYDAVFNTTTGELAVLIYFPARIDFINVDTAAVESFDIATETGGNHVLHLAANTLENKFYASLITVPNQGEMGIFIFDRDTDAYSFVGASDLEPFVFNPNSNTIFSGVQVGVSMGIVDGATDNFTSIHVGGNANAGHGAAGVRYTTDHAYFASQNKIAFVDNETQTVEFIPLPIPQRGGGVSPDLAINQSTGKVYVIADNQAGKVFIIQDPAARQVTNNDDFDDANIVDSYPYTDTQDVTSSTRAYDDLDCLGSGLGTEHHTVWYQLVAPAENGNLTIDTTGSDYDTALNLFQGSRGSMTYQVGCGFTNIQAPINAGETYYLEVMGSEWDQAGMLNLSISFTPDCVEPNAPVLTSPAHGTNSTPGNPIYFSWSNVSFIHQLQIDTDIDFVDPAIDINGLGSSYDLLSGLPAGQYHWRVRGINTYAPYSCNKPGLWSVTRSLVVNTPPTLTPTPTRTQTATAVVQTFTSAPAQDGWILESSETSKKGGALNGSATTFNLGDDAAKKQYLGILSFNTGAALPDGANILSVRLKVKKGSIVGGGNPLTTFQGFMVDIKKGFFGTTALQASDFQASASTSYGPFKPVLTSNWYTIDLAGAGPYVNKLGTNSGLTQIRLRFKLDDNNNAIANYLSLFSGNAGAANRPQLVITYMP